MDNDYLFDVLLNDILDIHDDLQANYYNHGIANQSESHEFMSCIMNHVGVMNVFDSDDETETEEEEYTYTEKDKTE